MGVRRGLRVGKFRVVAMPIGIADGFFGEVVLERLGEVDPGLIGQANQNEEDVGHFVCQIIGLIGFFKALLPVSSGNDSGKFTDFFHELGEVGEFGEVANADLLDPLVDLLLCIGEGEAGGEGGGHGMWREGGMMPGEVMGFWVSRRLRGD